MKKIILAGGASLILVATVPMFFYLSNESLTQGDVSPKTETGESAIAQPAGKPEAGRLSAEEIGKLCSSQKEIFKDSCIIQAAVDQLSVEACGNIAGVEGQEECRGEVYRQSALQKGEASYCLKLSKSKGTECVVELAKKQGDPALCQNVQYEQYLSSCRKDAETAGLIAQAVARKDRKICDNLSFYQDKERCFKELGIATNDPAYCELARTAQELEYASERAACYWELAVRNADAGYCEKAKDYGNWSGVCSEEVAKIKEIQGRCSGDESAAGEKEQCLLMANQVLKKTTECWEKIEFHSAYAPIHVKNCYGIIAAECSEKFSSAKVRIACQAAVTEARAKSEEREARSEKY